MNATIPNPPSSPQRSSTSGPLVQQAVLHQSESSLIDFLLFALRHRIVIGLCSLCGAGLGVVGALLLAPTFAVITTIELGYYEQGKPSLIESPESVIIKVTNAYLPVIERAHGQATGQLRFSLGLDVKNPRGTSLVVMTSKITTEREAEHLTLHRQVAEQVLNAHNRESHMLRTTIGLELDQARRAAAAVKDQAATLTLRRTLLQEKRTLVTQRLQEIDGELTRIIGNRVAAGKNLSGQDQVLTLMMLDLQLLHEGDKRDALQQQHTLNLAEEEGRLSRDEADLQRSQQDHDGRIAAIQARIDHLAETRVIGESQISRNPVGISRSVIAGLGLCLGLALGILIPVLRQALSECKPHDAQRPNAG